MSAKLPTDAQARKNAPIYRGVMKYFPRALAAVAELSRIGNEQHNPGQPMHWAREKSTDHHDCIARHLIDAGTTDNDGQRHSTKIAWRALAALELELEGAELTPTAMFAKTLDAAYERALHCDHGAAHDKYTLLDGSRRCGTCGTKIGQEDPPT